MVCVVTPTWGRHTDANGTDASCTASLLELPQAAARHKDLDMRQAAPVGADNSYCPDRAETTLNGSTFPAWPTKTDQRRMHMRSLEPFCEIDRQTYRDRWLTHRDRWLIHIYIYPQSRLSIMMIQVCVARRGHRFVARRGRHHFRLSLCRATRAPLWRATRAPSLQTVAVLRGVTVTVTVATVLSDPIRAQ